MGYNALIKDLRAVLADPKVEAVVRRRLKSFKEFRKKPFNEVFKEIVFCILTANFSASRSIKIIEGIGDKIFDLDLEELAEELRRLGHRYPRSRARYIIDAREKIEEIRKAVEEISDEVELREWLVKNVKGLGYKEASHFLRNIGYENLAIIDIHILTLLRKYGLISETKRLSKREYFEIEKLLSEIAREMGLRLAELDLYLWYMSSGKILK